MNNSLKGTFELSREEAKYIYTGSCLVFKEGTRDKYNKCKTCKKRKDCCITCNIKSRETKYSFSDVYVRNPEELPVVLEHYFSGLLNYKVEVSNITVLDSQNIG